MVRIIPNRLKSFNGKSTGSSQPASRSSSPLRASAPPPDTGLILKTTVIKVGPGIIGFLQPISSLKSESIFPYKIPLTDLRGSQARNLAAADKSGTSDPVRFLPGG